MDKILKWLIPSYVLPQYSAEDLRIFNNLFGYKKDEVLFNIIDAED